MSFPRLGRPARTLLVLSLAAGFVSLSEAGEPSRSLRAALAASGEFTVTRYDKSGRVVRELTIDRTSDSHARIVEWTASLKKRGFTLTTWIPELLVASDRVLVRFSGKRVFLIVRDDRGNPGLQYNCLYLQESDEMRAYLLSLLESDGAAVER